MNLKTLSVVALAGVMMLGSCKKNEDINNANGVTLRAGIEQANTGAKTSLAPASGGESDILWTAGDQILVNGTTFRLTSGAGSTMGTFNGPGGYEMSEPVTAAYPAANASIDGTTVTFTLPQEQTVTAAGTFGNGANPMVAYSTDAQADLSFTSVCGGIGIRLIGSNAAMTINKLVLTSRNTSDVLWGTFTVNAETGTVNTCSGGNNSITLNLPDVTLASSSDKFETYVTLPAGTVHGLDITAYYNNAVVKTTVGNGSTYQDVNITIAENEICGVAEFNYPTASATPGTPANQEELGVLVSQIAAGSYSGPVTLAGGTAAEPKNFDFGGAELAENEQVIIGTNSHVTVSNMTATVNTTGENRPPAMRILSGADATLNNVTLTSTSSAHDTRALNIEGGSSGAGINVTLNDCNLDGGTAGYSRGLNLWSDGEPVVVNVNGGEIHAGHYAINIPNDVLANNPTTINLSNASIAAGWAAINIWGSNTTINATNCTLTGLNDKGYNADGWNDFATVAFNDDNVNCKVELTNCTLNAEATTGNRQYAWRSYKDVTSNFIMHGGTIKGITTGTGTDVYHIYGSGADTYSYNYENVTLNWNGVTSTLNDSYNGTSGSKGVSTTPKKDVSSNEGSRQR